MDNLYSPVSDTQTNMKYTVKEKI